MTMGRRIYAPFYGFCGTRDTSLLPRGCVLFPTVFGGVFWVHRGQRRLIYSARFFEKQIFLLFDKETKQYLIHSLTLKK